MQHQKKRGKIFVKQFFRIKTHFFAIRGCFSQMFVLQKEFLFARGLNWDQSCLWKTPPSHFLLFSPLACPYFFNFFSSPDFWGVKEAPCKNLYVFGENWQRNQFPKLTTFLLHFSPMSPLSHSALWKISIMEIFYQEKLLRFSLIPNYFKSHIVIYDDPKMSPTDPKCPSEI